MRDRVRSWPGGALLWRIGVTIVGVAIIAIGIILLPLPGPGWLIIFGGLGLLATEYAWARSLLRRLREYVLAWAQWFSSQPRWVHVVGSVLGVVFLAAVGLFAWWLL